jgi:hypothetical protein
VLLWVLSFVVNFEHATWDEKVINGLDFMQNYVLQVPLFLMTLMRYVTPTLDNMWVPLLALHFHSYADITLGSWTRKSRQSHLYIITNIPPVWHG